MKHTITTIMATLGISIIAFINPAYAQGIYQSGTVGVDVSWPNCTAHLSSLPKFGIVGVTDGLGYSTNPCLAAEASHYANLSLYANTGWYSASTHINAASPLTCATGDTICLAYNYGYNAGLYALNAASAAGVQSSTWWLDVESGNTWSTDVMQNRSSLQGEHDSLVANGVTTIGIYSTTAQWNSLTGTWLNNWPSWGATTVKTAAKAKTYCTGHNFTGGPTWLIQFRGTIDQDYAC